jgi:hypothetical protein
VQRRAEDLAEVEEHPPDGGFAGIWQKAFATRPPLCNWCPAVELRRSGR